MVKNRSVLNLEQSREVAATNQAVGAWMAELRQSFFDAISADDMTNLARMLKEKALGGDLKALKLLMSYVVGAPGQGRSAPAPQQQATMPPMLVNGQVHVHAGEQAAGGADDPGPRYDDARRGGTCAVCGDAAESSPCGACAAKGYR